MCLSRRIWRRGWSEGSWPAGGGDGNRGRHSEVGKHGRGPRIMRMGANGSGKRMKEFGSRETGEGCPRSMRRHAKGSGISEAGKPRGGNVEIRESGTEGWGSGGLGGGSPPGGRADRAQKKPAPWWAPVEGERDDYLVGFWAWISAIFFSMSDIFFMRSASTFLRSLLDTMLRLAASLTTLAGSERRRVMRPWSLKELR